MSLGNKMMPLASAPVSGMARPSDYRPAKRRRPAYDVSLQTTGLELAALIGLAAFYLITELVLSEDWYASIAVIGPIALAVILGTSALRMLKINPANIWTALFWFRVTTVLYFCFGQVVPFFLNEISYLYFQNYYAPTPAEFIKLNLIIVTGVICVLSAGGFAGRIMKPLPAPTSGTQHNRHDFGRTFRLGILLLICGSLVKYLIVIPQALGFTSGTIPGAIVIFGSMSSGGIYLLTLLSLRSRNVALFVLMLGLTIFEMTVGLVMMTKTETLIPMLVFIMAILSHRASFFRLSVTTLAMIFMFNVLVPLVSHGRDVLNSQATDRGQVGITERLGMLSSYYDADLEQNKYGDFQGGFLRLSYASLGALFVNKYDIGDPGNSMELIFAVVIPRILWPEKPLIDLGRQMSIIVSGNENNAVGIGLYFESYWNFGWLGLPLLMIPFGMILAFLSRLTLTVFLHHNYILLPVVFIAMRVGIAIDNAYVGQIGAIAQIIVLYYILTIAMRMTSKPKVRGIPRKFS